MVSDIARPPASRTGPDRSGFTLIEVLVAFAVLVPIVVVAAGVLPFFRLSSARAWTQVAAADLAREQMERARATDFASLASTPEQTVSVNGTSYRWSMTVTPVGSGSLRKRVVVNVAWQHPQVQTLAFETVVGRSSPPPSSDGLTSSGSTSTATSTTGGTTTTSSDNRGGNSGGNGVGGPSASAPSPSPQKGKDR